MKLLTVAPLLLIAVSIGLGQNERSVPATPQEIKLLAEHEIREGGTLKLRGHVQVITSETTVYADEADYNPLTGDLDARGHVHIDFKKAKPSITIQDSTPEDMPATISPK